MMDRVWLYMSGCNWREASLENTCPAGRGLCVAAWARSGNPFFSVAPPRLRNRLRQRRSTLVQENIKEQRTKGRIGGGLEVEERKRDRSYALSRCPLIGKGHPQLSVIAGVLHKQMDKQELYRHHVVRCLRSLVLGAGRHHSVKWVLRYSIEGKGR